MKEIIKKFCIILLILILLFVIFSKYIKKDKLTSFFGYSFLIVLTGSMEPEINAGSLIIIQKLENYKIGDVITYYENNYLITHRIIEKSNEFIITKGDNNNEKDSKIVENQILGKVVFNSIMLGNFITKYLKCCFIIFTIFILIVNIFFQYKKVKEKKKSEKNNNKLSK